jgi:signal transduction histidine kinase
MIKRVLATKVLVAVFSFVFATSLLAGAVLLLQATGRLDWPALAVATVVCLILAGVVFLFRLGRTVLRLMERLDATAAAYRREFERNKEILAMVGVAAHEIRSPLMALRLMADLMSEAPGVFSRAAAKGRVRRQVDNLTQLAESLLEVVRSDDGSRRLRLERLDAVALTKEVIEQLDPENGRSSTPVTLSAPPSLEGMWDRHRAVQMVRNLVSNACKFGAGRPVHIRMHAAEGTLTISVRDHGPGISAAQQVRIFERFERAPETRHIEGHGLGLWIARNAARAHGGDLHVHSEPGHGAEFYLTLPTGMPTEMPIETPRLTPVVSVPQTRRSSSSHPLAVQPRSGTAPDLQP